LVNSGAHTIGHVEVEGVLTQADTNSATVRACIDTSHQQTVDSQGHSIDASNGPGTYWRYVEIAHMKLVGDRWLFASSEAHRDQTC
jgi:hypothetical protein